ncbi:MAG: dihydrolipoamide acetyltransferase family protein [Ktedonobacteraceae bacterium]
MPTPVTMPRLGESVAEGTIGSWMKQVGDYVEKDESLVEVITDKINAELPSPVAGRLTKILVNVDETVAVGTQIAFIEESADVNVESPAQAAPGPDAAPVRNVQQAATPVMTEASTSTSTVIGGSVDHNAATGTYTATEQDDERQRISPLARRLAREHNIDLNTIQGTGANGRVRKEDILGYVAQKQPSHAQSAQTTTVMPQSSTPPPTRPQHTEVPRPTQTPPPVQTLANAPLPFISAPTEQPATTGGEDEVVTPSRMRLAIAEHMVRSKRVSPHATTMVEVDMTNIAKWLAKNKDEFKRSEGYGMSYVPFVMKSVCEGIRKFPTINSTWTEDNKIIIKKRINLGIAVATDAGLVVPTLYDADQLTLAGVAKQVNAIAQRARNNKLTLQDMQGSTFVVNNPGVFGTILSVPIINQPHAGILSMDAVVKRAVVVEDDAIAVRSMMYLCLSFDHRILDGAGAGGFLQAVRTKLQSYGREIDVY